MKKKLSPAESFQTALEVAEYYGFQSMESLAEDIVKVGRGRPSALRFPKDPKKPGLTDRAGIVHALVEYGTSGLPQPMLIHHSEPVWNNLDRKDFGGKDGLFFGLEIVGSPSPIAEALLLTVGQAILKDLGFSEALVHLNSVGERESMMRFNREFSTYAMKHLEEIPAKCKTHLKKRDALKTLECIDGEEGCLKLTEEAPKPIASLSEDARTHFAEMLEYAEGIGFPYQVNHCLVGGKDWYSKTILELRAMTDGEDIKKLASPVLAKGGRYDALARKFDYKKDLPSVGLTLTLGGSGMTEKKSKIKKPKLPKVYLLQIGWSAKVKSLKLLESLRAAKIPVTHDLLRDRLGAQIGGVEKNNIRYTIIIGQREALEGTAIVRDMSNRSQITVPLAALPGHLKKVLG